MKSAVKDIMTTRVVWVREDTPFKELARLLREHRISAFPVLDEDGTVLGVVSEADLLTKEALGDEPGAHSGILRRRDEEKARGITAGDLMSYPLVAVAPDDTVEHAAELMYARRVKRLPVVDQDGHLAGIISRADVLAVFDRPDEEIRKEIITDVLPNDFLVDSRDFTVAVRGGVVTISGVPESDSLGHELARRVRHVQGVVAVRDRLSYLVPPGGGSE